MYPNCHMYCFTLLIRQEVYTTSANYHTSIPTNTARVIEPSIERDLCPNDAVPWVAAPTNPKLAAEPSELNVEPMSPHRTFANVTETSGFLSRISFGSPSVALQGPEFPPSSH